MTAILELQKLSCRFGEVSAVDQVSLSVQAGEILGLVGESGSGKSTLGRAVCGLVNRSSGEILIEGQRLPRQFSARDFRRQARTVQMVFQDSYSAMNPHMTVLQCLIEPLVLQGLEQRRERKCAIEWLERVGLSSKFAYRYPHELSGGQRQRVGIARALICSPRLVICDEPVSALDVSVQAQIVNLLRELQKTTGVAMIFIGHDLAVVSHLADRTAVMYHGRVVEEGGRELFIEPAHPYTQTLIAASSGELARNGGNSLLPPAASGCPYRPRCSKASVDCEVVVPALEAKKNGRLVACHFVG